MATIEEIITDVESLVRLAPGVGTHIYAEDAIHNAIKISFRELAREPGFWWPQLMQWLSGTLTGTDGLITSSTAFADIDQHEDIRAVYLDTDQRPLPYVPNNINPFTFSNFGRPMVEYLSDADKRLRIWPLTQTGTVYVHARIMPDLSVPSAEVPFDRDTIANKVAYCMVSDYGANPSSGARLLATFERNFQRVKVNYNSVPVVLDPRIATVNDRWMELY
jgi:hypothetical protein